MSSSTFEVKDTENEKVIGFGLENCDENGITMATQIDSELPKDHTYTKEPDVLEDDLTKSSETTGNQLDGAEDHATAEKPRASRGTKAQKVTKKSTTKAKSKSPKKSASSKKSQTKKEVLSDEGNTVGEAVDEEKSNEKQGPVADEEQSKAKRKSRKRKFEEKENVVDRSIVEEVENISEEAMDNNSSDGNPSKKKNAADAEEAPKAKKVAKAKKVLASDSVEDQHNLPKGWVRKTVVRKSGKTAGQVDVYIYSPEGIKFRSKPDIAAYLARTKSPLKLDDFSFSKKLSDSSSVKPAVKKEKLPSTKLTSPAKKKAKQSVASPKKSPKLLVKINFAGKSKKRNVKKSAEKASKSPVKEGGLKASSAKKLDSNYGKLTLKNGKVAKLPQLDGKTSKEKSGIKEPYVVLDDSLKKVTSGSTTASKRKSLPPRRLIEEVEDDSHEIPPSPPMENANMSHSPAQHKRKTTPPSRLIPENFDIEKLFLSPEESAVLSVTDEKLKRKSSNLQPKEASDSDKSSSLPLQSNNHSTIPATPSRKLATRIRSRERNSLSKLSPPVQSSIAAVVPFRRKRVSVPPSRLIAEDSAFEKFAPEEKYFPKKKKTSPSTSLIKEESSLTPSEHNTKNPSQVSPLKRSYRKKIPDMQDNVLNKSIIEEVQNISEAASNSLCVSTISKKRERSLNLKESTKEELYNDHINENKPCLPEGWSSKAIVRKSGKTAGNVDLYIYSPDGLKFRSKAEIAKYLKRINSPLKLDDFNISHDQLTKQENVLIPAKTSEEQVEPDSICDSRSKSSDSTALNSRRVSKTTVSKSPKMTVKNDRKSRAILESLDSSGSIFKNGGPQKEGTGGHTEFENHQEATPKTQTQNTEPSESHSLSGKANEMVAMENISVKLMRHDVDKIVQYEKNYPSAIKTGRRGQKKKFQEKENVIFETSSEELKNGKEEGNISGPSSLDSRATRKRKNTPLAISKKIPKRLNNAHKSPESLTATSSSPLLDENKSDQRDVPEGWMINLVKRKSGKTAGLVDIYIYSPEGLKFRSKPDLAAYLARTKSPLKLEDFSFDKKQITGKSK
ncbi:hypothetical protein X975_25495, partial [Stegodyphus mimosarum]